MCRQQRRRERGGVQLLVTVGFAYPSEERVAASSLAYHLITGLLEYLGVGVRRYFFEDGKLVIAGRYRENPRSNIAILASLPYELLYLDFAKMLRAMNIPLVNSARSEEDPIIIVGGPAVTGNPLPLWRIADALVIGEFEEIAEELINALMKPTRSARLRALAEIKSIIVPYSMTGKVVRAYVKDLDKAWYPTRQEVREGVEPVWGHSFMLETSRGCFRRCRFCMEGCIYKPRRDRSLNKLRELIEVGIVENKTRKISFYSLSFFDSPFSEKILEHAISMGLDISVPSLRAETITDKRARLLVEGGQKTIAIAPETGSSVMARAIMKLTGKSGTIRASEILALAGIKSIKLYLISGFPGESKEDIDETIDMVVQVKNLMQRYGGRVRVSLNPLIPKPSTPLQWFGFDRKRCERAIALARILQKQGIDVDVYPPDYAELQTGLGRSDAAISDVIAEVAQKGGGYKSLLTALRNKLSDALRDWSPEVDPPWLNLVDDNYIRLDLMRREFEDYINVLASSGRLIETAETLFKA